MRDGGVITPAELGRLIATARVDSGMSADRLADAIGVKRSDLAEIEAGERVISPAQLVAVTSALGVPVDWFFTESPPAVLSRRRDPAVGGFSRRLDLAVEITARNVASLLDRGVLGESARVRRTMPGSLADAENLARAVRAEIGRPDGPLHDLQSVAEGLGLLAFSLDLGRDAGDAACVEVGNLGVAVINGMVDQGRRRFSLAHELCHHLVGDAYEPSPRLGGDDTERMVNAFAAHLLMPRSSVLGVWRELADRPARRVAVAVAVRFSVSWTAACNQLANLDLIDSRERDRLAQDLLRKGELLEFGERYVAELDPPSVPPGYAASIVTAYREGMLTPARAVELLYGTVTEPDLPEPSPESLDDLRQEFDADL